MTQPKRKPGRPRGSGKPPEEKALIKTICIRPDQDTIWEDLVATPDGVSAWIQAQLDEFAKAKIG